VLEALADRELAMDDVLLRHVAEPGLQGFEATVEVGVVDQDLAFAGLTSPGQRAEQGRLARARGPDQGRKRAGRHRQRDAVEDRARGGVDAEVSCLDAGPTPGVEQPEAVGRQLQLEGSHDEALAVGERCRRHPASADERAVGAVEVLYDQRPVARRDAGVALAADRRVEPDVGVFGTPDRECLAFERKLADEHAGPPPGGQLGEAGDHHGRLGSGLRPHEAHAEQGPARAEADHVAFPDARALDAALVQERAVRAVEVHQHEAVLEADQLGVLSRDDTVPRRRQRVARVAAEADRRARQLDLVALAFSREERQPEPCPLRQRFRCRLRFVLGQGAHGGQAPRVDDESPAVAELHSNLRPVLAELEDIPVLQLDLLDALLVDERARAALEVPQDERAVLLAQRGVPPADAALLGVEDDLGGLGIATQHDLALVDLAHPSCVKAAQHDQAVSHSSLRIRASHAVAVEPRRPVSEPRGPGDDHVGRHKPRQRYHEEHGIGDQDGARQQDPIGFAQPTSSPGRREWSILVLVSLGGRRVSVGMARF